LTLLRVRSLQLLRFLTAATAFLASFSAAALFFTLFPAPGNTTAGQSGHANSSTGAEQEAPP
jgi:hypothetical protein